MELLKGLLLIWFIWGLSLLVMNIKYVSILTANKLKVTSAWQLSLYLPVWIAMCVSLIIISPPLTIKKYILNKYKRS